MLQIIADVEQGTDQWRELRRGLVTASEFHCLLANGRGGGESKMRRSYMLRLAAEVLTGAPVETYCSPDMARGQAMEAEARDLYAFMHDAEPKRVGFIRNGPKGCSPDSLIGENGMLEIKTQRGDLLIETLLKDEFPPAHRAQCQGALWIAERDHIDLCVYWPKMPLFVKRAYRDEAYIRGLADAVELFNAELARTVDQIRGYKHAAAA
jgi:hypothetical protein